MFDNNGDNLLKNDWDYKDRDINSLFRVFIYLNEFLSFDFVIGLMI
jgi:hypothetical protein